MAISNRTATTATTGASAAASLAVNKPTGTAAGDLLICLISVNNGSSCTITTLSGWTLFQRNNNTTVLGQGIYYRVADGTEGSSFTWSFTSEFASIVCTAYTGVDNKNPFAGFSVLAKTTASTSATFGATIPQAETCYGVLCITGRNTTASTTLTTAGSYTIDGQTTTTATDFITACIADQHATYGLPLASVTPTSLTFSTTSTDYDTVIFLRPDISTVQTLQTDVCTYAETLTSPVTTLKFGTGYANEWVFALIADDGAGTFSGTTTVTGTTLSWTLLGRANSASVIAGSAEVWYAKATTPLAFNSESVTVTPSTASSVTNVSIVSFINSFGAGTFVANEVASGTPSQALTTTKNLSWVWACLFDTTNNTAPTLGGSQTLVQDYLPTGEGFWAWRETAQTTAHGTAVTLNATAPTAIDYAILVFEVLFANPIGADVMNLNNTLGANISQSVNRAGTY